MYYFRKPIIITVKDEAVAREIDRLSRDELKFCDYVSQLIEKDLSEKLGKKVYDESMIIETEVTAVAKKPSIQENKELLDMQKKLDLILSMVQSNPNAVQMSLSQPSYVQQSNDNSSLAVEVPSSNPVVHEVNDAVSVEQVKPKEVSSGIKKKKKKGLFSTKGKDANSILSKMASMQK